MIVLLGSSGYVGGYFARELETRGIPYIAPSRTHCDYYDPSAVTDLIRQVDAEYLINCAGYTGKPNVDACEADKTECLNGNAILVGRIREACERANIPWGHVSSGCIFTGRNDLGAGFTETDPANFSFRTNNCSFYSGTKALGEEILADCETCHIWRLRIPFNHVDSPRNYLSKLMRYSRLLEAENSLSHLDDFVRVCVDCWVKRVPFGIYNATNTGSVTTRQVADLIRKHLTPDKQYEFFKSEDEFMQMAAIAPRSNCVLDNSKLLETGIHMRHVEEAIMESLQNWVWEPVDAQVAV
ncbi:MAG: SDR family oxidoreductase [Pirellula sp.]|jgi:dTDP-4-dehydrorhamnose reductase